MSNSNPGLLLNTPAVLSVGTILNAGRGPAFFVSIPSSIGNEQRDHELYTGDLTCIPSGEERLGFKLVSFWPARFADIGITNQLQRL